MAPPFTFCGISYNNAEQTSTKLYPFFANFGYHPNVSILSDVNSPCPAASSYYSSLLSLQPVLKQNLLCAQESSKRYANVKRGPKPTFFIGSKVLLNTKNLKLALSSMKFSSKFVDSFKILEIINPIAYRLLLPENWRIHNVFHVSLLKRICARENEAFEQPPLPIDEVTYEVAAFLDSRIKNGPVEYLFDWNGYGPSERTWQRIDDILNNFQAKYPMKPHR